MKWIQKWIAEQWNKEGIAYSKTTYLYATIVWFAVGLLPLFGYPAPFSGNKGILHLGILILIVLFLIIATCIIIFFVKRNKNDIIANATKMFKKEKYQDILTLRRRWSRFLWIEGKLFERLKLGEIAKKAAINLEKNKDLTEIYIDDLGWTNVPIDCNKAKGILESGLECAKKINNNDDKNYWIARAKRHLAGIELENMEYGQADILINDAISFANNIVEEQRKKEMLAGIYHMKAFKTLKTSGQDKEKIEKALEYAKKSKELCSERDKIRYIRIYSLEGCIYEVKGDINRAEQLYRTGLKESKDLGRIDEIIKNSFGLARISDDEKEQRQHLRKAEKLLKKTPVSYLIDEKEIRLMKYNIF
ncbi:MAG: hypothetical protein LBI42_09615 [Chitinispirillales bacterium]|jgi:tetratricopeptide (TPR) repeat protein|nr:hypothetical protein [Chitinispirillales bacterium]